ncbi:MAG: PIN/TRAM domain-containing protein, partial [Armatimonadota bacterium]
SSPAPKKKPNQQQTTSLFQWAMLVVFSIFTTIPFVIFGPDVVNAIGKKIYDGYQPLPNTPANLIPLVLAGIIVGWFLSTLLIRIGTLLGKKWEKTDDSEKVTMFVGTVLGFVVATFFISLLSSFNLAKQVVALYVLGIGVLFTAFTIYALHTMKETLPWYRGKVKAKRTGMKILDTNVIIDGRVYDVAQSGFIEGQIYVPQFVLEELQYIADSHDPLRRQRGKRGLDILKLMQSEFNIEVGVHDRLAPEQSDGVDSRLVRLATAVGGDLVTNDHNLNRVATLQNVRVLNINDLALSLRPNVLPQESLILSIVREGNQHGQGVGYLEDGTMVIVENGREHIGETREVMVTQVIQTERGKLIFAEVEGPEVDNTHRRKSPKKPIG